MREGYYFPNAFANGHKSIEALPSVLSSIPSYRHAVRTDAAGAGPDRTRCRHCSPTRDTGPRSSTARARGSMGFGAYASQAGVQHYYSREDYEQAQRYRRFRRLLGYLGRTVSAVHEPGTLNPKRLNPSSPRLSRSLRTTRSSCPNNTPTRCRKEKPKCIKGVAYTDLALPPFHGDRRRKEPWYDHTIFVFVADHVSSETFAPKTLTPTGNTPDRLPDLHARRIDARRSRCASSPADRSDADAARA